MTLQKIKDKCEQYWNARDIGDAEIHSILAFIHRQACFMEQTGSDNPIAELYLKQIEEAWDKHQYRYGFPGMPYYPTERAFEGKCKFVNRHTIRPYVSAEFRNPSWATVMTCFDMSLAFSDSAYLLLEYCG